MQHTRRTRAVLACGATLLLLPALTGCLDANAYPPKQVIDKSHEVVDELNGQIRDNADDVNGLLGE